MVNEQLPDSGIWNQNRHNSRFPSFLHFICSTRLLTAPLGTVEMQEPSASSDEEKNVCSESYKVFHLPEILLNWLMLYAMDRNSQLSKIFEYLYNQSVPLMDTLGKQVFVHL